MHRAPSCEKVIFLFNLSLCDRLIPAEAPGSLFKDQYCRKVTAYYSADPLRIPAGWLIGNLP